MVEKNITQVSLANGVRGVLVNLPGLSSVTVQVILKIGSKYEQKRVWGISHFLEHMAFKGTKKRPTAGEIHREMDSLGAAHNAGTSHEYTDYWIKTAPEYTKWAVEILADMLLDPIFPAEEVKKERGVIVEEINMYNDNPMMGLVYDFMDLMYVDYDIGCWNVAGTRESVLGIGREDLMAYRQDYLAGANMVVVVAGRIDNEQAVSDWISQYFARVPKKEVVLPVVKMAEDTKKEFVLDKSLDQIHFALGFPTISWSDPQRYVAKIWDLLLAGNTSSRMWQKIREERGLAYYIMSISEDWKEAGYLGIQAGVKRASFEEALGMAKEEMLTLPQTLTEEELVRAKKYLRGKTKLLMDRTDFWADFVGRKLLLEDEIASVEDELTKYDAVSLEQIRKLAKEKTKNDEFRLAVRK